MSPQTTVHPIIFTHGREFCEELLDKIIIQKKISGREMRDILVKYNKIKKTTKQIDASLRYGSRLSGSDVISLNAFNGRNEKVFDIRFREHEIPKIVEDINTLKAKEESHEATVK